MPGKRAPSVQKKNWESILCCVPSTFTFPGQSLGMPLSSPMSILYLPLDNDFRFLPQPVQNDPHRGPA